MGRHSHRLVKGSCEMICGEDCHGSQRIKAYFVVQMGFDVLADALCEYRRQSAAARRGRFGDRQMAQGTDSGTAMHKRFSPAARGAGFAQRRREQYAPPRPIAGARELSGNVPIAGLTEY